jgi:D-alanyl-D-alanine carboxypeptidase
MRPFFPLLIAGILLFNSCNYPGKETAIERQSRITKAVEELLSENEIPGLNVSIIFKNGKQENYSAGYANINNEVKLNRMHILFSGSIGKTYAVAVLMQLVDEGKLQLSDLFLNYFPGNEWLMRLPNINDITVEMLLQHTSGLPRYVIGTSIWDTLAVHPDKVWSYEERLSFVFDAEAVHPAGEGWAYSDTGYLLIGMLIEKLTGNNYYDEVQKRLLDPSNLTETYGALRRDLPNIPVGYSRLPEEFRMPEEVVQNGKYVFNPQLEWTGGGFASSTPDLARWAVIYFQGKMFSDSLLKRIITPNKNGVNIDKGLSYGMGSFIYEHKGDIAYGHTGFIPGFNSIFTYFPEYELAIAVQTNCDYSKQKMKAGLAGYVDRILEEL